MMTTGGAVPLMTDCADRTRERVTSRGRATHSDSGARCRVLVVPSLPGGLFGGTGETSNAAPGLGFSQGAGRDAQAFADVLTESEQGLKGGRVGAVGERIQQGAGFGRNIGWFSAHGLAKLTVRTPSGSSKRRVQDVSGQCHVAVPAAGSYLAV